MVTQKGTTNQIVPNSLRQVTMFIIHAPKEIKAQYPLDLPMMVAAISGPKRQMNSFLKLPQGMCDIHPAVLDGCLERKGRRKARRVQ